MKPAAIADMSAAWYVRDRFISSAPFYHTKIDCFPYRLHDKQSHPSEPQAQVSAVWTTYAPCAKTADPSASFKAVFEASQQTLKQFVPVVFLFDTGRLSHFFDNPVSRSVQKNARSGEIS